jgi:hypothetical protein
LFIVINRKNILIFLLGSCECAAAAVVMLVLQSWAGCRRLVFGMDRQGSARVKRRQQNLKNDDLSTAVVLSHRLFPVGTFT